MATLQGYADDGMISVQGGVRLPGTFHVAAGECLSLDAAIRRAGNVIPGNEYNDGGDLTATRVQRIVNGSVVEYTIDASPGARGGLTFMIQAGDYIRVPWRTFNKPFPVPVPYGS
jgi:hypothetical protein